MKHKWINLPITLGHMRKGILSYRKHLKNIGMESVLDSVQVNIGKVLAYILLGRIVDEDIDSPEPIIASQRKPRVI